MEWLTEPLQYEFFVRALQTVVLVSVLCAVVGSWVVLRGLSYVGDAMSHAVLPGIVAAFVSGTNLLLGAFVAAALAALGMSSLGQTSGLKQDSVTYIVFVGMFALGIAMMSRTATFTSDLSHFLIGNPLGVTGADLAFTALATALVLGGLLSVNKELLLASFDPTEARAIGLPTVWLDRALLVIIGLVVVLVVQLVGTTLSVSLLIGGATTARLHARSLGHMMTLAALFGALGGCIGLYLSYHLDTASGATIVLVNTAIFALSLLFAHSKKRQKGPDATLQP